MNEQKTETKKGLGRDAPSNVPNRTEKFWMLE